MGWVAKDATSFGFPRKAYPNQTEFAGDRPDAGNGKLAVKDKNGKPELDKDGKPKTADILIKPGESHNGKKVSVEEQTDLLKYSIEKSGFGKARSRRHQVRVPRQRAHDLVDQPPRHDRVPDGVRRTTGTTCCRTLRA